jgi:NAD(P)-dependent dehydrogenase (short-subunit alcohol dehydrogenase family)
MMTLEGRVVVVTGASGGIGAGLAAMLAEAGARVVLASRREAALERVATDIRRSGGSALPIVTDLARDDSLANLVAQTRAELGQLDILVNNAGYASRLTPNRCAIRQLSCITRPVLSRPARRPRIRGSQCERPHEVRASIGVLSDARLMSAA